MTKVQQTNDGKQITLSTPQNRDWPDVRIETFDCDGCEEERPADDQHIVWQKPWHGEYWGDIMWTGSCCADDLGADHHSLGNPDERNDSE